MRMVHVLVSYEDEKLMSQRLRHGISRGIVDGLAIAVRFESVEMRVHLCMRMGRNQNSMSSL